MTGADRDPGFDAGSGKDRTLTRAEITTLLTELGARLDAADVRGDMFIVRGAAMALAYNTRRMTADVDGVFEPKMLIYDAATHIAARHPGLPVNWLNDAVKGLLPGQDTDARVILDVPGLTVSVASPRYLLALKVQAARIDRDADDILLLADACGARTAAQVLDIAATVVGEARLQPKAQFLVEELFAGR